MAAREVVEVPLLLVQSADSVAMQRDVRLDPAHVAVPSPKRTPHLQFTLGNQSVAVAAARPTDRDVITKSWEARGNELESL